MDELDNEVRVYEVSEDRLMSILYSEVELDGVLFDEDDEGVTVIYAYGGLWSLNLFLLALAWSMGPELEPRFNGYQQIQQTLTDLTLDMPLPVPAPEYGSEYFSCKLPNVRIVRRDR